MYEISSDSQKNMTIRITGALTTETTSSTREALLEEVHRLSPRHLSVDLQNIPFFNDFGALILVELRDLCDSLKIEFQLVDTEEKAKKILDLVGFESLNTDGRLEKKYSENVFVRLGGASIKILNNSRYMLSFIGSIVLCFLYVCRRPKALRMEDTITCMEKTGVDALPVVGLISFLLGLIMAFMSSLQLKQYGATILVAQLVALAMVSELGPIMTAIVVAGRSGSAYAAEIGTMKISEEVDALFTMGFDPTLFLAIPRIIAAVIVVPVLTMFSNLFAILGGLLIGISMLDLTPGAYMSETFKALSMFEVVWGLTKSAIFAALIAGVGCLRGFEARGGSSAVGNAATSSVVTSIFLIILFDSVFAVIRSYWN